MRFQVWEVIHYELPNSIRLLRPMVTEASPLVQTLVLDPDVIQASFPFVTADALAMLHARRCGWLSAQQLGMVLLEKARQAGVRLLNGRVTGVTIGSNRVDSVLVQTGADSSRIATRTFVNAAGPLVKQVGSLLGVDLPVFNELHGKIAFEDDFKYHPARCPIDDLERSDFFELERGRAAGTV